MKKKIFYLIIPVFTAILYFAYLGNIDLWDPDEPRYCEVVREMFSLKQFLVPHLNGQIYGDKPPLFFWSMAGFVILFHSIKEWVLRLTPAISGFLTVILTFIYSKKLFNKNVAIFSSIILSTSYLMVHLSRRCNIDTFFTLLILISTITIHYGLVKNKKFYYYLSCLFQGLAIITKGPLGFIIPLFTLIGYLVFTKDKEKFKSIPWLTGFIILLIPVAAWLVPATIVAGKEYTYNLIMNQVIHRFEHGIAHPHNSFYYFYQFPLDFMPWSLFLPFLFLKGKVDLKNKNLIWLIFWFAINFLFLSISKEKRGLYLLPIYPAFAIIMGYMFTSIKENNIKLFKVPAYLLIILSGILGLAEPVAYFIKTKQFNFSLIIMGFLAFIIAFYFIKFIKEKNVENTITFVYLLVFLTFFNIFSYIFPLANPVKSPKYFVKGLNKYVKNYDNLLIYGYYNPGINFYLKKDHLNVTKSRKELEKFVKNKIKFILVYKKDLKRKKKYIAKYLENYKKIWTGRIGHRKLILFYRVTF